MKKIIFIAILSLLATNLSAMTIETNAERDTVFGKPLKAQKSFGKLPSSGKYGIFLNITISAEEGDSDFETLFFLLESEVVKEGKSLSTTIAGKHIPLAEKKWTGWKIADNVKILYSAGKETYPVFKVWLEVE